MFLCLLILQVKDVSPICLALIHAVLGREYGDLEVIEKAGSQWDEWVEAYKIDFVMRGLTDLNVQLVANGTVPAAVQKWLLLRENMGGESKVPVNIAKQVTDFFTFYVRHNMFINASDNVDIYEQTQQERQDEADNPYDAENEVMDDFSWSENEDQWES